jgi:hypothetical protein
LPRQDGGKADRSFLNPLVLLLAKLLQFWRVACSLATAPHRGHCIFPIHDFSIACLKVEMLSVDQPCS